MIDEAADHGTDNHRSTVYYDDAEHALSRLAAITRIASTEARGLTRGRRHAVILAGMTALYAAADDGSARNVHELVARTLGAGAAPIRWSVKLRWRLSPDRVAQAR